MRSRCGTETLSSISCDLFVDRHALRNLLRPFEDPMWLRRGNIQVRNRTPRWTFSGDEYLIAIHWVRRPLPN